MGLYADQPERNRAIQGVRRQYGGNRSTRGHYEVQMRDCTVELDGKTIIARGRIVNPAIVVQRQARQTCESKTAL